MLKKSKRTLSLVLALVMLCSTMGVMAFAADGGESVTFSGNNRNNPFTVTVTSDMGVAYTARISVAVGGYCYPEEGTITWTTFNVNISGELSENYYYTVSSAQSWERTIRVYYQENNNDSQLVRVVMVSVNADGRVTISRVS